MNYCNPEGFRNEIKALLEKGDIDGLYHWFDGGETKEGAFEKGADVFTRVIKPYADKYLKGHRRVALDLGYGMGTKIPAALNAFPRVIGVDVHDEYEFVLDNIGTAGNQEVELLTGDGDSLPVNDAEVNFVYSWIVFCHLGTIENVNKYLWEIMRVLQPGGVAVIYFTRLIRSGRNQSWKEVEADMNKERAHPLGYREGGPESKVRSINLVISMTVMEQLATGAGFELLEKTASWDDTPGGRVYHGQYGVVLRKPFPKTKPKETKKPTSKKTSTLKRGK